VREQLEGTPPPEGLRKLDEIIEEHRREQPAGLREAAATYLERYPVACPEADALRAALAAALPEGRK
jgi:hypothetical protein